ncbi:MAG TPA: universal stress protein [Gaiellales bacterium]|jgi:nucleotide-binding universal stress UspA family protein|nr:universal stress protein [Gaiellales bacterium]
MTPPRILPDAPAAWSPAGVFTRIVCGVDGSDEGFEAVRQVARLATSSAEITLASVWNTGSTVALGWSPPAAYAPTGTREEVEEAVARARRLLPDTLAVETVIVQGPPAPMMSIEARRHDATLVAIGTHGHGRLPGILLGSVATQLLHNSPCPVLLARPGPAPAEFPRSIIVATDGSPEASRALAVAEGLAGRLGAGLEAVVVADAGEADTEAVVPGLRGPGGRHIPLRRLRGQAAEVLGDLRPDLLVIGSRGLRGLRSLGSVSERVAHESTASVLVVR